MILSPFVNKNAVFGNKTVIQSKNIDLQKAVSLNEIYNSSENFNFNFNYINRFGTNYDTVAFKIILSFEDGDKSPYAAYAQLEPFAFYFDSLKESHFFFTIIRVQSVMKKIPFIKKYVKDKFYLKANRTIARDLYLASNLEQAKYNLDLHLSKIGCTLLNEKTYHAYELLQ